MAGNVSIPNTFAAASGVVPAIRLDENWNVLRDYINAREITQGTLGSRPAASTSGRLYYATDTAQLFADTGTTWTQIGAPSGLGIWAVRRATGLNNSGTPLTQYDVACDAVQLRNPVTGQVLAFVNPGTRTNNILTAGPAANGRDQAGAFSANSWIHLYDVTDGITLATVSSIAGPTIGPTLPGGYTASAYMTALRLNASTQFIPTRLVGSWMYYLAPQSVVAGGAATTFTSVDLSGFVPPNALAVRLWLQANVTAGAGSAANDGQLAIDGGTTAWAAQRATGENVSASESSYSEVTIPNLNQVVHYRNVPVGVVSAATVNLLVTGYQIPNSE